MSATRVLLFLVGVALVIVAAWMLFFQTGLDRWIPLSIAGAALLLFVGLAVMGASERVGPPEHVEEGHHH